MKKTRETECNNKISVDLLGLQEMLSVGRGTAERIGSEAGAIIRIGRRKLYNVKKVERYMEQLAEG